MVGLSDLTVLGYGAVIMVEGISGALSFSDCSNLHLAGLTIDQPRVPFSAGRLTSISGDVSTFVVNATLYPPPSHGQGWLNRVQATMEYDPVAERPAVQQPGAERPVDDYSLHSPQQLFWNGSLVQIHAAPFQSRLKLNAMYVLRHQVYGFNAITFNNLTRPVFRDLQLLSIPGVGIAGKGAVDLLMDNVQVKKTSGRAMSLTADAVHLTNARGQLRIQNCFFEGQGDDGINIPTQYNSVLKIFNNRTLGLGFRHSNTDLVAPMMSVGDRVLFRSRRSFSSYFTTKVAAIDLQTPAVRFQDILPAQLQLYDLVLSTTDQPNSVLIQNNTFKNNRARGLLLKQHSALVIGNRFVGSSGPAIQAVPDGCKWFEGDVVRNWTIQHNVISNNNYGAARQAGDIYISSCVPVWTPDGTPEFHGSASTNQQPHSDVRIVSNYFYQFSAQAAVSVTGVDGVTVASNQVVWNVEPEINIWTLASTKLNISANLCHGHGEASGACTWSEEQWNHDSSIHSYIRDPEGGTILSIV